ncbi:hypothetical protein AVEN_85291-1 [Araneus ventricosus]|uniref:Gustatory receptor n=1 Tax=Araneus ventricosus TaxID=182803 RepID=A0A4Y2SJ66_ARAVE|nr:hypothetical protein AVEN_136476-1 [Araneus ventricosus]GBN87647.1 hypothetical protein AVEN_85291-1 [Araneus ventricosus]
MKIFDTRVHTEGDYSLRRRTMANVHPLRPVLTSLAVLGFKIEDSSGAVTRIIFRLYLVLVTASLHYWALSDVVWYFRNRIQEDVLAESVTVWASMATVDLLIWKRKSFLKILSTVKTETEKLSPEEQRRFKYVVWMVCFLTWGFNFLYITQNLLFSLHVDHDKYFSNTPLYFFYKGMSEKQIAIFIRIDRSVECFFIQGTLTMIISLYILLCINAKLWLKKFDDYDKPASSTYASSFTLDDVRCFRATFDQFARNIERLDDVFCEIVAMWLLMILITLCVRVLSLLNPRTPKTDRIIENTVLALSRAIVTLFVVSLVSGNVYDESVISLNKLEALVRRKEPVQNFAVYHEVQIAFQKFSFFPTQLTVWKVTPLNRSFLMTCIGMMTTYVIICIQLNPSVLNSLSG